MRIGQTSTFESFGRSSQRRAGSRPIGSGADAKGDDLARRLDHDRRGFEATARQINRANVAMLDRTLAPLGRQARVPGSFRLAILTFAASNFSLVRQRQDTLS